MVAHGNLKVEGYWCAMNWDLLGWDLVSLYLWLLQKSGEAGAPGVV